MREILFRGKRKSDGQWLGGDVAHNLGRVFVGNYFIDIAEVDPNTVGQYTGLVDRNGRKIFEGDILASQYDDPPEGPAIEVVVWHNGAWCQKQGHHDPEPIEYDNFFLETSKVIGNIHDNPELLEGGGERWNREKLIELLYDIRRRKDLVDDDCIDDLADELLANGVVVLPCRCSDCGLRHSSEYCECRPDDFFCGDGIRKGGAT